MSQFGQYCRDNSAQDQAIARRLSHLPQSLLASFTSPKTAVLHSWLEWQEEDGARTGPNVALALTFQPTDRSYTRSAELIWWCCWR